MSYAAGFHLAFYHGKHIVFCHGLGQGAYHAAANFGGWIVQGYKFIGYFLIRVAFPECPHYRRFIAPGNQYLYFYLFYTFTATASLAYGRAGTLCRPESA